MFLLEDAATRQRTTTARDGEPDAGTPAARRAARQQQQRDAAVAERRTREQAQYQEGAAARQRQAQRQQQEQQQRAAVAAAAPRTVTRADIQNSPDKSRLRATYRQESDAIRAAQSVAMEPEEMARAGKRYCSASYLADPRRIVCGVDGKTYASPCAAVQAGIYYWRACPCTGSEPKRAGLTYAQQMAVKDADTQARMRGGVDSWGRRQGNDPGDYSGPGCAGYAGASMTRAQAIANPPVLSLPPGSVTGAPGSATGGTTTATGGSTSTAGAGSSGGGYNPAAFSPVDYGGVPTPGEEAAAEAGEGVPLAAYAIPAAGIAWLAWANRKKLMSAFKRSR